MTGPLATPKKENEMSIYPDEQTKEGVKACINRIRAAFPDLDDNFYKVLVVRVRESGMGDLRLMDAVNHVIDTCIYPKPTIAQFLNYDIVVKLYTWKEVVAMNDLLDRKAFSLYKRLENGKYASKEDIAKFGLV